MTPSNQHSDEAIAEARRILGMAADEPNAATGIATVNEFEKIADIFDAGRASITLDSSNSKNSSHAITAYPDDERIVHDPQAVALLENLRTAFDRGSASAPVSTITDRETLETVHDEAFARYKALPIDDQNGWRDYLLAAILSSGVLVDRGESDAQALEAAADELENYWAPDTAEGEEIASGSPQVLRDRASRLRSGKAEE